MDQILQSSELEIEPVQGQFDLAEIATFIEGLAPSFQDETDRTMFVVCSTAASRDAHRADRRRNPQSGFPYVLLLKVTPGRIDLDQAGGEPFFPLSLAFLTWLETKYTCRLRVGRHTAELRASLGLAPAGPA